MRQTDSGFGVDARAGPGGPSSPDLPLPVRSSPHDLCHEWDLPLWLPATLVCTSLPYSIHTDQAHCVSKVENVFTRRTKELEL